jgi:hypothetical protein
MSYTVTKEVFTYIILLRVESLFKNSSYLYGFSIIQWWKLPQKFMSYLCSFLSITAGHFTLEFPSLYETEDWT